MLGYRHVLGRRNVILSGAAAVVGYPSQRNRATQADLVLPGGSSRWAVLDRQARFLLSYYNAWVFQARTSRGAAQAFLVSSSPNDEVLSADDMATVTSAIQRAIAALRGVSSCQTTQVNPNLTPPWNSDGGPSLIFGDAWTVYGYNCTIQGSGVSQAWFAYQTTDASAAVQNAFAALPEVAACTKAPRPTVTPASIQPLQQ
jgi:hypothetical protein